MKENVVSTIRIPQPELSGVFIHRWPADCLSYEELLALSTARFPPVGGRRSRQGRRGRVSALNPRITVYLTIKPFRQQKT